MIAATDTILSVVGGIVIALVAGGAITLLIRWRPEAGQITVSAAQGAVIVQTGVIESLNDENRRLQGRVKTLETAMSSVAEAHARISHLERENTWLKEENARLTNKVSALERQINGERRRP